jgi:hypothetical protein
MTRAATHGASTSGPRNGKPWNDPLKPDIDALVKSTLAAHPWLDRPEFLGALRSWASATVRIARVEAWVDEHGMLDGRNGKPKPATEFLLKLETTAARARAALGFDPASFAQIMKTVADTPENLRRELDAGVERGRQAIAARAAAIEAASTEVVEAEEVEA